MAADSTVSRKTGKPVKSRPPKPYPDYPLTPHSLGYWCKQIRGKIVYFGRWGRVRKGQLERIEGDGWKAALDLYKLQADDLYAGRTPRTTDDGLTVAELCNRFLTSKERQRKADEITHRTVLDYKLVCDRLVAVFGNRRLVSDLAADDFEALRADISKTRGLVCLANDITRTRVIFKFAFDSGLILTPMRYGPGLKKPTAAALRRQKQQNGSRMFERDEILALLDAAPLQLRAMILLGVNCGCGNADCAGLRLRHLDLERGWLDYPRQKTAVERRAALWPETVEALKTAIAARPSSKKPDDDDLVFLTQRGNEWVRVDDSPLAKEFRKLLDQAALRKQRGVAFYGMRRTFRTVADATRDYPAVNLVMGHTDSTMGATYRQRIDDSRLQAVADYVRSWLFGGEGGQSDG